MNVLADITLEFRRHKSLADRALEQVDDTVFFGRPEAQVNPLALVVKHLSGNLLSRWTDFLASDGEKPTRNRDQEFVLTDQDTRPHLLASWEQAWGVLFQTLAGLTAADLGRTVTIRGESHTAIQALLRGLTHVAYHVGQILYIVRLLQSDSQWLTIAPGQSQTHKGRYRQG